jgi:hypothetical protein
MGRKPAFIIAGVLLMGLMTLGTAQVIGKGEQDSPESDTPEATELRKLRQQVLELEESAAHSERMAREAQAVADAARMAVSAHGEKPPAPPRQPVAPQPGEVREEASSRSPSAPPPEVRAEEVLEQLDERFFSEPLDPGWSHEARRHAEQFGGTMPKGARVLSLECRSSLCRMETTQPNLESFQDFVRQGLLGGKHEWKGPIMAAVKSAPNQPGEILTVTYLAREGVDLSPSPRE